MLYVYIGCFTFGMLYSLISAVLGGDGADGGADGIDLDVDAGGDGVDIPSPLNPLVIASAITAFGAAGLIAKLSFKLSDMVSSLLALGFAGLIGAVIFFGVVKLMYGSQSNSTFSMEDLIGIEAEVITPLPSNGLGEIAYIMNGVRYNMTAKSAYQKEIPRGEKVIVKEIAGNVAVVTQIVTIDEVDGMVEDMADRKTRRKMGEGQ